MPFELLSIPFEAGIDTKTDVRWLRPGQHTSIVNGRMVKKGSIEKRRGYKQLSSAGFAARTGMPSSITSIWRLFEYDKQLCAHDGHFLWTYSQSASAWQVQDHVTDCVATRKSIAQSTQLMNDPQVAEANGYRVFVWNDGTLIGTSTAIGNLFFSVLDINTGSYIFASQQFAVKGGHQAAKAKLITQGTNAILAYYDTTDNTVYLHGMDLTNPQNGWSAFSASPNSPPVVTGTWDLCPVTATFPGNDFLYVADTQVANGMTLYLVQSSGIVAGTGTVVDFSKNITEANHPIDTLAVRADAGSNIAWFAYSYHVAGPTVTYKLGLFNASNLNTVLAPTLVTTYGTATSEAVSLGIEQIDSTHACINAVCLGTSTGGLSRWFVMTSGGVLQGNGQAAWHGQWHTRPFMANGRCYAVLSTELESSTATSAVVQPTHYLVDLLVDQISANNPTGDTIAPRPVATIAPRFSFSGAGAIRSLDNLGKVTQEGNPTTTSLIAAMPELQSPLPKGRNGCAQVTLNFRHPGLGITQELGETLMISGGVPSSFDGGLVSELGFLQYPESPFGTVAIAAGGLAKQKYSYQFVWEWTDLRGNRYMSEPSEVIVVDLTGQAGTSAVTFQIETQSLTTKQEADLSAPQKIGVVMYRTQFISVMSTVLFRVDGDAVPVSHLNNPTIESISITDTGSGSQGDAAIGSNAILYTAGGVLPYVNPSSFIDMCVHRNRIVGIGDDARTVYMSNAFVEGSPPNFTDTITFTIDESQGGLVACFRQDSELYFATSEDMWFYSGDGPLETGQQSQLDGPFHFQTAIGVLDPRSVVEVPDGTMFLSARGITLLTRARTVEYIGAPVEALLQQFPNITSAVQVPADNEVRFTCNNAAGTAGTILVYNYLFKLWSQWNVFDGSGGGYGLGPYIASATLANGVYYWATDRGAIYQENVTPSASQFKDAGTWITLSVSTVPVAMAGVEGYLRLRCAQLIADSLDKHDLTMTLVYNHDASGTNSNTWSWGTQIGPLPREELQLHTDNLHGKVESVQVVISDAPPTNTAGTGSGQGPRLAAVALEYRKQPGRYRQLGSLAKG